MRTFAKAAGLYIAAIVAVIASACFSYQSFINPPFRNLSTLMSIAFAFACSDGAEEVAQWIRDVAGGRLPLWSGRTFLRAQIGQVR
jgi:hypothetical protein